MLEALGGSFSLLRHPGLKLFFPFLALRGSSWFEVALPASAGNRRSRGLNVSRC